jgi:hypothetical protein
MGGDAMAYASLGNWVDSNTVISATTDTSGRVIGINIPASTSPGLLAYVSATGLNLQGVTQSVAGTFPILAGYVTYGTIRFL